LSGLFQRFINLIEIFNVKFMNSFILSILFILFEFLFIKQSLA